MKMEKVKGSLNKLLQKSIICNLFLCILFVGAMCLVLSHKVNYDVDEIFTYGKSNYQSPPSFYNRKGSGVVYIPIEDGKLYVPGGKALMDYVTVQPEHRFNYANVWRNEAKAVHPPVHSALVHTISSFFPGRFSLWFAASVNIVFAVLTLLVLRLLSRCYVHDERVVNIISLAFVLSGGILSAITFLRMYIMAMFWVTLLTYCFVKEVKDQTGNKVFFMKVFAVTAGGALSHYYCILYAALISATYVVWLLFGRKIQELFKFCAAMTASGIVSCFVFPAMIQHILFGPRGREVMRNAATFSDFFSRLESFSQIINREIFANWGVIWIFGLIVLFIYFVIKCCRNRYNNGQRVLYNLVNGAKHNLLICYMVLVIPTVMYFLIVTKITVYRLDRYMFPIYANIFLLAYLVLIALFDRLPVSKLCKIGMLCITLCIITVQSWFTVGWPYLYLSSQPLLEKAEKLSNVDNICLYKASWCTCVLFKESQSYRSIQFCNYNNQGVKQKIYKRIQNMKPEKLVVTLVQPPDKHEEYLNDILKHSVTLNHYQKLGSHFYDNTTSYLLY